MKNHYKNIKVYFGYSLDNIKEEELQLYKTGRTNANDGGIDFVMRPVGRFFQVTEVNNYDKYLLDIDKVLHFPITFVIKTKQTKKRVLVELSEYIAVRANGMKVIEDRYNMAIEEIITINDLQQWTYDLDNSGIDEILRDTALSDLEDGLIALRDAPQIGSLLTCQHCSSRTFPDRLHTAAAGQPPGG